MCFDDEFAGRLLRWNGSQEVDVERKDEAKRAGSTTVGLTSHRGRRTGRGRAQMGHHRATKNACEGLVGWLDNALAPPPLCLLLAPKNRQTLLGSGDWDTGGSSRGS